ncbi:DUF6085 family protein [Streptomyces sp. NPDC007346]|uniref:DUF6085 family protein n=1 Tax=Streptomyces sp. NPDC007346 TaxID=3154682 RepID=UPI003455D751
MTTPTPGAPRPDTTSPDSVRTPEPTSLLGQMTEAMRAVMQQRVDDRIEASVIEHCAVLAAAALGHVTGMLPPTGHRISGRCPACGRSSLFLAVGGYVTCSRLDCPRPDATADLLDNPPFATRTGCHDCPTGQELIP